MSHYILFHIFFQFFTAVYIVEWLTLRTICVVNKEILQFFGLISVVYNQEQFQTVYNGVRTVYQSKETIFKSFIWLHTRRFKRKHLKVVRQGFTLLQRKYILNTNFTRASLL